MPRRHPDDGQEAYLAEAAGMMALARGRLTEIEETKDAAKMRELIELLVTRIIVETEVIQTGGPRRKKAATGRLTLAFSPDSAAVSAKGWRGARRSRSRASSWRCGASTAGSG
jgi:hypothetical protein